MEKEKKNSSKKIVFFVSILREDGIVSEKEWKK